MKNPGCNSTNHENCYGELWTCKDCGIVICSAEGTDDDPDICDSCWVEKHIPTKEGANGPAISEE